MKQYPAGSEFRKWDLHVHTPASLVQHYGGNNEKTWEEYLGALRCLPSDIKVLGINDYLLIDGYRRVRDAWDSGDLPNIELLLPVLELRLDRFGGTKNKLNKVNYHVIFSDRVAADLIQSNFIQRLDKSFRLTPDGGDYHFLFPSRENLEDLGRAVIASVPADQGKSYGDPLSEGFNNLTFGLEKIQGLLAQPAFQGNVMTAVGKTEWADIKWNNQSISDKKAIVNSVDWVFSAHNNATEYQSARNSLLDSQVNHRLLDCSDAHWFSDSSDKDRLGNCSTWIKADPTFEGLKLAHREFEDRVWIGEEPPKHQARRKEPTRFFASISIEKIPNPSHQEKWFELKKLPLNSDLIAIIGGKGSGKSALAETISLLCNAAQSDSYSFLHKERFRRNSNSLAKDFRATLAFRCEKEHSGLLSDDLIETDYAKAVCLPQSYIEKVCNTIDQGKSFQNELEKVIFDHIPVEDRQGARNLQELQDNVGSGTLRRLASKRTEIESVNKKIVEMDRLATPDHYSRLENHYCEKRRTWLDFRSRKPPVVLKPEITGDVGATCPRAQRLEELNVEINSCVSALEKARLAQVEAEKTEGSVRTIRNRVQELVDATQSAQLELAPDFRQLNIDGEAIFSIKLDFAPIEQAEVSAKAVIQRSRAAHDLLKEDSPSYLLAKAKSERSNLENLVAEPQKIHARYREELSDWEGRRRVLLGSKVEPDSILHLRAEMRQAREAGLRVTELRAQRNGLAHEAVTLLRQLCTLRQQLFAPIQKRIDSHTLLGSQYRLVFETALHNTGFSIQFFNMVSRQKTGSFYGSEQSEQLLKRIDADYPPSNQPVEFALAIEDSLLQQRRNGAVETRRIVDQVKSGNTPNQVLDFLFKFQYLEPIYSVSLAGKPISLLSPGEKGALLLIFYLLVDQRTSPLIIDQPEENLDNQTVFELLVPAIKEAKKNRQVIIVTHNPNLAVVCDAEQIICASRDADDGNRITYTSGAIESPEINAKLLAVLEGTRPAFDNRSQKYLK